MASTNLPITWETSLVQPNGDRYEGYHQYERVKFAFKYADLKAMPIEDAKDRLEVIEAIVASALRRDSAPAYYRYSILAWQLRLWIDFGVFIHETQRKRGFGWDKYNMEIQWVKRMADAWIRKAFE